MPPFNIRFRLPDGTMQKGLPPSLCDAPPDPLLASAVIASIADDWLPGHSGISLRGGYPPRALDPSSVVPPQSSLIVTSVPPEKNVTQNAASPSSSGVSPSSSSISSSSSSSSSSRPGSTSTGAAFNIADHVADQGTRVESSNGNRGGGSFVHQLPDSVEALAPSSVRIEPGVMKAIVRKVPDDNSCLFSSLAYTTCRDPSMRRDASVGDRLRYLVRDYIAGDLSAAAYPGLRHAPEPTEALLGKSAISYAAWIADARHWGGEIELSILAHILSCEICVLDARPERVAAYGEGCGYGSRVFVMYDGLHYDPVAFSIDAGDAGTFPEDEDVVVVDPRSSGAETLARALLKRFHDERRFTSTADFTLRCGQCGAGIVGEKGAIEHSQKTGHASFQEYVEY